MADTKNLESAPAGLLSRLGLLLLLGAALPLAACSDEQASAPTEAEVADVVEAAPEREQIPWDLSDMYDSYDDWNASREHVLERLPELEAYRGRLGESPEVMLEAFRTISEVALEADRAYVYANLLFDEDQDNTDASAMTQQVDEMLSALDRATSWSDPEILALGEDVINDFIASDPEEFERFRLSLQNTLRNSEYILSEEGEAIMAAAGILPGMPSQTYNLLVNSDITWPTIELDGEDVYLDASGYSFHRADVDREDRIRVFDTYWGAWENFEATVGQILNDHIQNQVFIARARGYDSTLQMNLFGPNLPEEVYTTLVEQVNESLPLLHRYLRLRARLLGVDDFGYYDIYPEALELDRKFDIYESRAILIDAVAPLGEEYQSKLQWATGQGWEHVYPEEGKQSGAYQWGAYGVHPYVLLNHQDDYESLSTYAHEWGHGMHSLLSEENNPFETADYSTFIAETASISNEILVQDYMIEHASSDEERLYYIDRILEGYRGTLFRQTQFAEFEHAAYREVEEGRPLTGARLSEIYLDIVRRYHGHDEGVMTVDDEIKMEWAYIPHFYRNYYVFQYSTSLVQANYFMEQILSGVDGAQENYLQVLRAGGSDYAYNIVRDAGLDMASAEAYAPMRARLERILDQYEELLDNLGY